MRNDATVDTGPPKLVTGWDPGLPPSDTVTRRYLFHFAEQCASFALAAGGRVHRDDRFIASDLPGPGGYFASAVLLQPLDHGDVAGRVLDDVEAFYDRGVGAAMLWSLWPTPDLHQRGWELVGHPPLLIRPPGRVLPPPAPPPVDVRPVSTSVDLAQWERVVIEGYPLPELSAVTPGELAATSMLDDQRARFWLGYEDGVAVSAATLFVEHGIGCFALGVTRPEARRRGFWMRHAVDRINAEPDLWMTGVFSDFSRSGAETIGFVPVCRFTLWSQPRREAPR